ncbi:hypothetical protein [Occultella kanbiaonis]|uniref:hypothetical protein n=1 Tax=Occultella kanbiaonis TaxID=2675754 RepID=UPI0012B7A0FF|nr:hypothetical protein [Occultella kanbiaonis]
MPILDEQTGRECRGERSGGAAHVDTAVRVGPANEEIAAGAAVVVLRTAGQTGLVHGDRDADQVSGIVPAAVVPEVEPCVAAVDREVRRSEPCEVARNTHGLLERAEGGVVVDTGDPLRQVEPVPTDRRRCEVQEHGNDRVVVKDDLPTGCEAKPS